MVEVTDLIVWSTIVQTIVLTLTLVIFIFSFRSQEKSIREQAYQSVMDDYGNLIRRMSETPELYQFQMDLFKTTGRSVGGQVDFTRKDLVVRNHVIGIYGFFERLHSLYRRKWISKEEWNQWAAFLRLMARHPLFRDVHQSSREMWDKPFVDYVDELLTHDQ